MESPPTKFTFIHEAAPGVSLSDRARASVEESGHSNYYSYRQTVCASGQQVLAPDTLPLWAGWEAGPL